MRNPRQKLRKNEDGIVAIVVTILFLIVISLTALGVAHIARREQRQALDNQLASQANYLAETGINDAIKAINTPGNTYAGNADKTSCSTNDDLLPPAVDKNSQLNFLNPISGDAISNKVVDGLGTTARGGYSCVLINHAASTVEVNPVATTSSSFEDMQIVQNDGVTPYLGTYHLVVSWSAAQNPGTFRPIAATDFPPLGVWGATTTGILRLDITKMDALNRAALDNATATTFLYPSQGSGLPAAATPFGNITGLNNRGRTLNGSCSVGPSVPANKRFQECNAVIDVPYSGVGINEIFLRLKTIYNSNGSNVTIAAFDSSNAQLKIRGAQTVIDSTGKVADVVKRLQVRVNTSSSNNYPEYAVESVGGICKLEEVAPPDVSGYADEASGANPTDQAICDPNHQ